MQRFIEKGMQLESERGETSGRVGKRSPDTPLRPCVHINFVFIRVHFHCGAHSATATVAHVEWLHDLAYTAPSPTPLYPTHACGPGTATRQHWARSGLASVLCVCVGVCSLPTRVGFGLHLCGSNNVSFPCPSAG